MDYNGSYHIGIVTGGCWDILQGCTREKTHPGTKSLCRETGCSINNRHESAGRASQSCTSINSTLFSVPAILWRKTSDELFRESKGDSDVYQNILTCPSNPLLHSENPSLLPLCRTVSPSLPETLAVSSGALCIHLSLQGPPGPWRTERENQAPSAATSCDSTLRRSNYFAHLHAMCNGFRVNLIEARITIVNEYSNINYFKYCARLLCSSVQMLTFNVSFCFSFTLFIYSYPFLAPLLLLELLSYWHALNGHSSVPISGSARV